MAEYNDSGVFHLACDQGHQSVTVLQQNRFELLFEIACNAINDGYYREAVSSFAASLERFYEYAIRVMLKDADTSPDVFSKSWKEVSNQSERQLGAFIFLWAACFGEKPGILDQDKQGDWPKFRNRVVHKGAIPSKEEAILFGEKIHRVIAPLRSSLSHKMADACAAVMLEALREMTPKDHKGPVATASVNFFMRDSNGVPAKDLRGHLALLKEQASTMRTFSLLLGGGKSQD
ncbi:hypothetical protein R1H25_02560 [Stenotrophomonas sp. C2852]|uniref:hypothetical protein n=1 Tax=Stenotrophomonas sp. C2852 TaxID=3077845 RepID=UPI00293C9E61|nr:hypothetical protein [Stenotrophomonas sp. C2852]MDV3434329.1 hypothetical protein [Stenotrophomonas sp. C2852]